MPRSYVGRDDRGNLGFDLGDGGPPIYLPPTAETAKAAMQFEAAAGRDPSLVLAPRRGAMSPDALAENASMPDGRKPSILWDPPAPPQKPRVVLDVAPAPAPVGPPPPPPVVPAGAPLTIESGPGDTSAAKASGMSQPQIDAALKRQQAAPPPASAAPAGPALSAGDPSKGLVATPGGGRPAGPADPYGNLNPAERQLANLYDLKAQQELQKRASPGTLVKGGKVQTAESWQGVVGPNADTVEAQRANAAEAARLGKTQAAAYAERDARVAEIAGQQAAYEQSAAEIQAEIGQRKQAALADIGGQARALQQKIAAAEVDPNGWYAKKSTGERIGIGVALALDGITKGLTRRVGGPNEILAQMAKLQAQDIDLQIKNIDKQRGDLNDLQRIYVQTKEQFGDEALAADATKLAGLAAFKAQIAQEAAKADAVMQTDPVFKKEQLADMAEMEAAYRVALGGDTPLAREAAEKRMQALAARTRSYSVKGRLAELAVDKKALDDQAALEERMNGALSKSFGFTQDRMVGGSSGPSLDKVIASQKAKADLMRGADNDAAKNAGKDEQKMIFVDGVGIPAAKGASAGSVDKAQDLITFADQGLDLVASAEARAKQGGGFLPGDPRLKIASAGIASVLSNAQGGGAPNDNVMKTINDALTPGPRQQEAINELRGEFVSAKKRGMQRVGAAKLWRLPSRCTTPRPGHPSRSTPHGPGLSSARARPPSPLTRMYLSWAQTARSGSSRAPTPGPSSSAPRAWRPAPPRGSSCASSSCKRSSAGSAARSARPRPAWPGAPRWASAMPS